MTATPDTSLDFADGAAYHNYIIQGWRGVDATTPLDVALPTEATGSSANPNSPSVTPVTSGALVFSVAHMDDDDTTTSVTPTGYTNKAEINTGQASTSIGATTALASKEWSSGAEDPSAWTFGTIDSWAANTIAFRPAAGGTTDVNFSGSNRGIMRGVGRGVG